MGVHGKNFARVVTGRVTTNDLRVESVTLTNAQILAMAATPPTLVAAKGAGTVIEFVSAMLFLNTTAGAYTETTANLQVKYTSDTGVAVSQAIEATGFADTTDEMVTNAQASIDAIATDAQAVNQPLVLDNTGAGEWGGGNAANTMKVITTYRIHASGY